MVHAWRKRHLGKREGSVRATMSTTDTGKIDVSCRDGGEVRLVIVKARTPMLTCYFWVWHNLVFTTTTGFLISTLRKGGRLYLQAFGPCIVCRSCTEHPAVFTHSTHVRRLSVQSTENATLPIDRPSTFVTERSPMSAMVTNNMQEPCRRCECLGRSSRHAQTVRQTETT